MPLYEFECDLCGSFAELRTIKDRDRAATCAVCDQPATRVITAPNLSLMPPIMRLASARNERSQHEPRVSTQSSCCSGARCSHKRPAAKTKAGKPALRTSRKKNRRPWMLGH